MNEYIWDDMTCDILYIYIKAIYDCPSALDKFIYFTRLTKLVLWSIHLDLVNGSYNVIVCNPTIKLGCTTGVILIDISG